MTLTDIENGEVIEEETKEDGIDRLMEWKQHHITTKKGQEWYEYNGWSLIGLEETKKDTRL